MKIKPKKKKKSFNLLEEYKESWEYIKESRIFIYSIIGIFLLFVLIGFFIPAPEIIYNKIMEFINGLLKETQNMSQLELINFIILNNTKSTFLGILLGLLFGIFPIISAITNGYMLGFVSLISVDNRGILNLWRILPHGIFELPAVFISLGIGVAFGINFVKNIYKNYFIKVIPSFSLFFLLCLLLLPLTLLAILPIFLFFIYKDYILYYYNKKNYFFLIISVLFPFILFFNIIFNKNLRTIWNEDYSNSLKVFLLVIIPLLILAGIIEGLLITFIE